MKLTIKDQKGGEIFSWHTGFCLLHLNPNVEAFLLYKRCFS